MALPVYVGKMIYVGNWVASPIPRDVPGRLDLEPDFLLDVGDLRHDPRTGGRVVFRDISNSTNERSFVSALVPGLFPCGNVLPVIEPSSDDVSLKSSSPRIYRASHSTGPSDSACPVRT